MRRRAATDTTDDAQYKQSRLRQVTALLLATLRGGEAPVVGGCVGLSEHGNCMPLLLRIAFLVASPGIERVAGSNAQCHNSRIFTLTTTLSTGKRRPDTCAR